MLDKLPSIYDAGRATQVFIPDVGSAAMAGAALGLAPAAQAKKNVAFLGIDYQRDFIDWEGKPGALPVAGSRFDVQRATELLYLGTDIWTDLVFTMDWHVLYQISHSSWWLDMTTNEHPDPTKITPISWDEVESGRYKPLFEIPWSRDYVKGLGVSMVWPYHCMAGSEGATIAPALFEAAHFVAAARMIQPTYMTKGSCPQTEHYGPFEPCVRYPHDPQGTINTHMLDLIGSNDVIIVAGEAEDYCVREGMNQVLKYFANKPDVLQRIRFVRDLTSPVFGGDDKRAEHDKVLDGFAALGVQIVTTANALDGI